MCFVINTHPKWKAGDKGKYKGKEDHPLFSSQNMVFLTGAWYPLLWEATQGRGGCIMKYIE